MLISSQRIARPKVVLDFRSVSAFPYGSMTNAALQAATGNPTLSLGNATAGSVMTCRGPLSLATPLFSAIAGNRPRFQSRSDDAHRGLLLEMTATNSLPDNTIPLTSAQWSANNNCTTEVATASAPDGGATAIHTAHTSPGFSRFCAPAGLSIGSGSPWWTQIWMLRNSGSPRLVHQKSAIYYIADQTTLGAAWTPLESPGVLNAASNFGQFFPMYGYAVAGASSYDTNAYANTAGDSNWYLPQLEINQGGPTSTIMTSGGVGITRSPDLLTDSNLRQWLAGGTLNMQLQFVSRWDFPQYDFTKPIPLWWIDANNNLVIQGGNSSREGGVLALTWLGQTVTLGKCFFIRDEIVTVYVEAGGGQPSWCQFMRNGNVYDGGQGPSMPQIIVGGGGKNPAGGASMNLLNDTARCGLVGEVQLVAA